MMDACCDPRNEAVVYKTSAQVGKTTICENVAAYYMDQDPAPILMLQPTIEMAETFSKDRLAPMLRDTPKLHGLVTEAKTRDSANTLLHKSFPGGHFTMAGANSPASLASRPVRIVICDEVDRYPDSAGTEGDPVKLAQKRCTTFWNRLLILTSTPTIAGMSRIDNWYERSDQRRYLVPCPHCSERQMLVWERVRWERDKSETALYWCLHCDKPWSEGQRLRSVNRGEWVAQKPFRGIAGFAINEIYSPFVKLSDMAQAWMDSEMDLRERKVFINTALGETWKEKEGEAPDWRRLYERRDTDNPIGTAPEGVLYVTSGVDVQKDRIEITHWGWGRRQESWLLDHVVLDGDTARNDVWLRLDGELQRTFPHPSGAHLNIVRMAIDSGFATQEVYRWARQYQGSGRVIVLDPRATGTASLGQPKAVDLTRNGKTVRRGARVWPLNVSSLKSELYGWLSLEKPTKESNLPFPAGFVHLNGRADEEFCKQLTAEQLFITLKKGFRKYEWQKMRERNEALDCRNYARGAALHFGADRFGERQWRQMEDILRVEPVTSHTPASTPAPVERQSSEAEEPAQATAAEQPKPPQTKRPIAKRKGPRVIGKFRY